MNEILPTLTGYDTLAHILENQPVLSPALSQGIAQIYCMKHNIHLKISKALPIELTAIHNTLTVNYTWLC